MSVRRHLTKDLAEEERIAVGHVAQEFTSEPGVADAPGALDEFVDFGFAKSPQGQDLTLALRLGDQRRELGAVLDLDLAVGADDRSPAWCGLPRNGDEHHAARSDRRRAGRPG